MLGVLCWLNGSLQVEANGELRRVSSQASGRRLSSYLRPLFPSTDRGWGKPTQQVAANVSFFDQMSDEEQRIMLAALEAIRDA
jgi:hypothetical protein